MRKRSSSSAKFRHSSKRPPKGQTQEKYRRCKDIGKSENTKIAASLPMPGGRNTIEPYPAEPPTMEIYTQYIKDPDALKKACDDLAKEPVLGFDTETTELD